MKPSVGRAVHYVSFGSAGGEYPKACRAATVTEVDAADEDRVGLMVANPSGLFFHSLADGGCHLHDGGGEPGDPNCLILETHGHPMRYCACGWTEPTMIGGTWHWPERVD